MATPLDQLPAEDFESLVQSTLPARAGDAALELQVESVWRSPYPTSRALPGFSLLLRGPLETPLSQGLVTLAHPAHGELEIFITPIGRDRDGLRYEAVFN